VDHGCRAEFVAQPYERPQHQGGQGGPAQSLYCASDDGRRNFCPLDVRGGVQLVKQRSGAACQEGYSWGPTSGDLGGPRMPGGLCGERAEVKDTVKSIGMDGPVSLDWTGESGRIGTAMQAGCAGEPRGLQR